MSILNRRGIRPGLAGKDRRGVAAVVGPAGLVPTRAGPDPTSTNAALQDSSGQITDSGAPNYDYPALSVDELGADGLAIEAGDTVGIAYYHDTITGGSLGTLVGLPSTVRLAGLGDCSTVDRVSGVSLTGIATILLDFQVDFNAASRQWLIDTAGTGWSIYVEPTTSGRIRVSTKAGAVFTMTGLSPVYNNARLQLACRLSGTSSQARLYDGTGTLISSNSATGTAPTPGSHDLVGLNGAGTDPLLGTLHRFATWTTALTDGQADDVAAGTNDHGPQNDADGLKTGVYDDADQTRLIWSTTGTNPVTAE